jgi:hypothetical protein
MSYFAIISFRLCCYTLRHIFFIETIFLQILFWLLWLLTTFFTCKLSNLLTSFILIYQSFIFTVTLLGIYASLKSVCSKFHFATCALISVSDIDNPQLFNIMLLFIWYFHKIYLNFVYTAKIDKFVLLKFLCTITLWIAFLTNIYHYRIEPVQHFNTV